MIKTIRYFRKYLEKEYKQQGVAFFSKVVFDWILLRANEFKYHIAKYFINLVIYEKR